MKLRIAATVTLFLSVSFLAAQNGDNKKHKSMDDIVPKDIIPPAPVLDVKDALKSFTVAEGFEIEAVAAEPFIDKPVAVNFDNRGRMWVTEMRGYMTDIDGTEEDKPMGRIAILEDTTGDGQIDKRTTFLDNLLLPRALAFVPGGILYGDQNKLFFVGRDGDKPRGEPIVVDETYAKGANVEHKPNMMMTGIDNWFYNAKSAHRYKWTDGKLIKDETSFRGQWGITRDDFGRLFFNSNSTLLIGDRVLPNLTLGNDAVKIKTSIATRIGSNAVHPGRITPGLNRAYISSLNGYRSNTIDPKDFKLINATAACGPVIYRGNQFPPEWKGRAFVCESGAQLVKVIDVEARNGELSGSHPLGEQEFLTSTDERFRPVNAYTAPDGSLYIVDFYHGIIQHKTYMTTYLRRQTLSRSLEGPGLGHGRIYRIKAKTRPLETMADLSTLEAVQLVEVLQSENGIQRDLAQKELIDRKATEATPRLRKAIANGNKFAKIHAVWTLEGLGTLEAGDLKPFIASDDEELVSTALYAADSLLPSERAKLVSAVITHKDTKMTRPYKARVLASIKTDEAQQALGDLLKKSGKEAFVREAAIAGLADTAPLFISTNEGSYKDKQFNEWLKKTSSDPKKKVDPVSLLKGEHLASHTRGKELYLGRAACIGCHGSDGAGLPNLGPTLDQSDWVTGDSERLTKVLLHGLQGPITINGKTFTPQAFMPGLAQNPSISDQDLADIITYIRSDWGNRARRVKKEEVAKIRATTSERKGQMYSEGDFKK
ncbi:MAG: DUF7133 domain-containing protein [Akkermansiaceae bacterium]